ncbi:MAG: ribosome small subunit-dependent GTPase A [Clostridia bacterium]|nr:ribosome small subunit-dependent GTPase A [Clostridia bacterium]
MEGKVLFFEGTNAIVRFDGGEGCFKVRGKIKNIKNGIIVGDNVLVNTENGVVEEVQERRNQLIRPSVANIDQIIICLSFSPPADLLMVDKLIIASIKNNITPIICITKNDILDENFAKNIKEQYKGINLKIITASVLKENGLIEILSVLRNKTSVLAGQSGVGKSSLINAICGTNIKTSNLVKNDIRGKNTTTASRLYTIDKNTFIIDTPGFCTINLELKNAEEILSLYPDIYKYASFCKYKSCNHINKTSEECGVIYALNKGEINKERLNRFYKFYETESGKRTKFSKGIKGGRKNV